MFYSKPTCQGKVISLKQQHQTEKWLDERITHYLEHDVDRRVALLQALSTMPLAQAVNVYEFANLTILCVIHG